MKIGNKTIVANYSLIIPQDEIAEIQLNVNNWILNISIEFQNVEKAQPEIAFNTRDNNNLTMIFKNWKNSLGMSLKVPAELGETNGKKLFFLPLVYCVGETYKLDLEFLLEE